MGVPLRVTVTVWPAWTSLRTAAESLRNSRCVILRLMPQCSPLSHLVATATDRSRSLMGQVSPSLSRKEAV
jgi:hypothetical protein